MNNNISTTIISKDMFFSDFPTPNTYISPPNYCEPYPTIPYYPNYPITDPYYNPPATLTPVFITNNISLSPIQVAEAKMKILCLAYEALSKCPEMNAAQLVELKEKISELLDSITAMQF